MRLAADDACDCSQKLGVVWFGDVGGGYKPSLSSKEWGGSVRQLGDGVMKGDL